MNVTDGQTPADRSTSLAHRVEP